MLAAVVHEDCPTHCRTSQGTADIDLLVPPTMNPMAVLEAADMHLQALSAASRRACPLRLARSSSSRSACRRCSRALNHARRLLVEAAWHHRRPYRRPGVALRARLDQVPAPVRQRAEQGNRRLHQRWTNLDARRKRSTVSAVAVARELSGWCWSLAIMED
ncbi:hypothetical protein ABT124_15750 [Streptomyces sp. NPDC001982]|uniref:hypothetical protein n=1 Tax=Streptomyces sp. NPDC001982 TaxID=3154405 RepID=UPI003319F6C1